MNRWILGIDTTSVELGIGLWNDSGPVCSLSRYRANSHAEHITKIVEFVLGSQGLPPERVTHIAVAAGPGSFTGLRIGAGFVKGFCFMREIRVLPVSSLHCTAACCMAPEGTTIVPAFDARRGDVFKARFVRRSDGVERLDEDALSAANDFIASLSRTDYVITDDLGYAGSGLFDAVPSDIMKVRTGDTALQRGLACARIAAGTPDDSPRWITAGDLSPRYIRSPAAEEKTALRR